MPQIDTATVEALVASVRQVRLITDKHPELKPVAQELLSLNGPLPILQRVQERPATHAKPVIRSAAQRKKSSLLMKRRWAAVKKAGKTKLG